MKCEKSMKDSSTDKRRLLTQALGLLPRCLWLFLCAFHLFCPPGAGSAEIRYRVVQLMTNEQVGAALSTATGINRFGDVCGYYEFNGSAESPPIAVPFVYKDAIELMSLVSSNFISAGASDINDNGQVSLYGTPDNVIFPTYRYTPGVGCELLGALYNVGDGAISKAINSLGQVVGYSDAFNGTRPWQYGFLYTDGIGMTSIGSLNENAYSSAKDINDIGQVTGASGGHAFLYTPEAGMVSIGQGAGFAINNRGVVAGKVGWRPPYNAAIYRGGTNLVLTPPDLDAEADDINDYNVVVGLRFSQYPPEIFVWTEQDGVMGLNEFIEPGWRISWPGGINDHGQIAAEGYYVPGNAPSSVAVRLDPIPPKLAIHLGPTNAVVSWAPNWPGLVLESTESLSVPDWQPLATGGTNLVSVAASSPLRFFRLNLDGVRGLCCPPQ